MYRGMTNFRCDKCGATFSAADIEYMATVYSMPQTCPRCQSNHTMPVGVFGFLGKYNPTRLVYKHIWETMDEKK